MISDNFRILYDLAKTHRVVIVTNKSNYEILANSIKSSNIHIVVFNPTSIKLRFKLLNSFFKWSLDSTAIYREIKQRNNNNLLHFFSNNIRLIIHLLFRKAKYIKKFARFLSIRLFNVENFLKNIDANSLTIDLKDSKVIFATSLTNLSQDAQVALFAKKQKIRLIGSVRSWDNLACHHVLVCEPDIFIAHSEFMHKCAVSMQDLQPKSILPLSAPNYRKDFKPIEILNNRENGLRIAYGCLGPMINKDEYAFLEYLNEISFKFSDISFSIIQHPIFPHDIKFKPNQNIFVEKFDYDKVDLKTYYYNLSKYDFLFSGGSSILLDGAFSNIPFAFIAFEINKQEFWNSALRYIDYLPHTREFIKHGKVDLIGSRDEFESIIENLPKIVRLTLLQEFDYFQGNIHLNFSKELMRVLINSEC